MTFPKTISIIVLLLGWAVFAPLVFSDETGNAQEQLGKAIQEAASMSMAENPEMGPSQEKVGAAIRDSAQISLKTQGEDGAFQSRLGRAVRDSAFLAYAQGLVQEEIGQTIVEARS